MAAAIFFPGTHDELSERETTRSLQTVRLRTKISLRSTPAIMIFSRQEEI